MTKIPKPQSPPRLTTNRPLPPTRYIPGHSPRPNQDVSDDSGMAPEASEPPDPERWQACEAYLYGIDLFNHGYYWEAHEVWEELWQACGRRGVTATFLKGLIALAAVGLKLRTGNVRGTRRHAARAADLFEAVATRSPASRYMGLHIGELGHYARTVAGRSPTRMVKEDCSQPVVFAFVLWPE